MIFVSFAEEEAFSKWRSPDGKKLHLREYILSFMSQSEMKGEATI